MQQTVFSRLRPLMSSLAVPIAILLFWQASSSLGWINPQILPSPLAVLQKWLAYWQPLEAYDPAAGGYLAWLLSGELIHDVAASLWRVVLGFALGGGLGLLLGLFMGVSDPVYRAFNPLIQFLRPIPPIAWTPLSILWFGLGNPPAVFLITIGAFFPILMNTISGVRNVDGIYIRAARNLGASRATLFRRVILPAATPFIFTGARVGMGTAFIVVIVAEMIAVNSGVGYRIMEAREYFWTDKVIAGMVTIGILGLLIDVLMQGLNNRLLKWHRGIDQ